MNETETRRAAVIEAARALHDALKQRLKPIPPDCFTAKQYAEVHGIHRRTAHDQIAQLVELKLLEPMQWTVQGSRGPHRVMVYRVK